MRYPESSRSTRTRALGLGFVFASLVPAALQASPIPPAELRPPARSIHLAPTFGVREVVFSGEVDLPPGEVADAWTAISATHEYVLSIDGREASRSRYGRVASAFRLAEEVEDLGPFLSPGKNRLVLRVRVWSEGRPEAPSIPQARMEGVIRLSDGGTVPLFTHEGWTGAFAAEGKVSLEATPVLVDPDPQAGRLAPRISPESKARIQPRIPVPLSRAVREALPGIDEMSVWSQEVVRRDPAVETARLLETYPVRCLAERFADAISRPPTHMGDSYSIAGWSIGNGWVWTSQGAYPFHDLGVVAGPEYQYPVQWNPGSTFLGESLGLSVGERPVDTADMWMWKIRRTDVVATAGTDPGRRLIFHTVTFAPPGLKALIRIHAVANDGDTAVEDVRLSIRIPRARVSGRTLVDTVRHEAMKAGDANVRVMSAGILDEVPVEAQADGEAGVLRVRLGTVPARGVVKVTAYRVFSLESVAGRSTPSDLEGTLASIRAKGDALLGETIRYWRDYNARTTHLEAPGEWGRRIGDWIDDQKMLVQTQQFERTGAVGPMSFFSDQWIRDASGPIRSFLATGASENARRSIDYFHTASVANRIILNWFPMDIDVTRALAPVEDWNEISVHAGGGDHVSAEVPNWLILQHLWYVRYTGKLEPVREHWDYLKRLYRGQFDNPRDKISRPDFKLPFHGDETYIYSGGEALWEDRYDLEQSSYPGGSLYSADSSFEFVAAGDALVELGRLIGRGEDAAEIERINAEARARTESYYWMEDLGFYAQGMSILEPGQLNRYPMANIAANVTWCGYGRADAPRSVSTVERMVEYLMEPSGVVCPIVGYDVTVGMLQGQCLHALSATRHPWAERAFHSLFAICGDTTEYTEWMAPGADYRTMFRANRLRPWEGGINLEAALYFLSGYEPDAPRRRIILTPRLPRGVGSPIRWDSFTLAKLPMGKGSFDLTVAERERGRMSYALKSEIGDDATVVLNGLLPRTSIRSVRVGGAIVDARPVEIRGQTLVTVEAPLRAGGSLAVEVDFEPVLPAERAEVQLREFRPTEPASRRSDVVLFQYDPASEGNPASLEAELRKGLDVLSIDASLPTDPASFRAALLSGAERNSRLLILGAGSLTNRKPTFWCDPRFDEILGEFLRRGGVVLELSSGLSSSRWLEDTLAPATFSVDSSSTGFAVAMDEPDPALDEAFRVVDEMNIGAVGKGSAYWEGWYDIPYADGGSVIRDHFFIWGEQEQPHGAMQFTVKCVPGRDHGIRVRTTPRPRKGFTLQVPAEGGGREGEWRDLETVWVPEPPGGANGWVDVLLTLPAAHARGDTLTFRLKAPKGSFGGIGYEPERLASTGAARIWIRDGVERPPPLGAIRARSAVAKALGLPAEGVVGHARGRIRSSGFTAPYRILGESGAAALILKPVGAGLYAKCEVTLESSFPPKALLGFIEAALDEAVRRGLPQ